MFRKNQISSPHSPRASLTLVEMLIVAAVLAILASLMQPALIHSIERARRLSCLGDRRQLGISVINFTADNRNLLPHPVKQWRTKSNRTMSSQIPWSRHRGMRLWEDNDTALGLGVLAAWGYVSEASLLFCPDYKHFSPALDTAYDSLYPEVWKGILSAENDFTGAGCYRVYSGVAYHGMVKGSWLGQELWDKGYTRENTTLNYIAENWANNVDVSPILISCANESGYTVSKIWPAQADSVGAVRSTVTFGAEPDMAGVSHHLQGLNAVFCDGSARWIDANNEVIWMPSEGHLMSTHYRLNGNFSKWAHQFAQITFP
ncbi:MAG: hypothetical protein HQL31_06230 [Planctomycetes bacterium]|nr:hypothetical protein [Planctomycetota bacterium]